MDDAVRWINVATGSAPRQPARHVARSAGTLTPDRLPSRPSAAGAARTGPTTHRPPRPCSAPRAPAPPRGPPADGRSAPPPSPGARPEPMIEAARGMLGSRLARSRNAGPDSRRPATWPGQPGARGAHHGCADWPPGAQPNGSPAPGSKTPGGCSRVTTTDKGAWLLI